MPNNMVYIHSYFPSHTQYILSSSTRISLQLNLVQRLYLSNQESLLTLGGGVDSKWSKGECVE